MYLVLCFDLLFKGSDLSDFWGGSLVGIFGRISMAFFAFFDVIFGLFSQPFWMRFLELFFVVFHESKYHIWVGFGRLGIFELINFVYFLQIF